MNTSRWSWLIAVLAVLSLVAAACGDDEEDTGGTDEGTTEDGGEAAGELEGEINISGSSTVEPISTRVAELFEEQEPGVLVNVDGPGTGDGFQLFCNGETDISDASRAIDEEEIAQCEENGIEYVELQIAIDGLSVITNQANDAVECLTFADLYALIGPESEGFDSWADGQEIATELGSPTELPDAPLDVTGPGAESGTYDSFIEIALEGISEERAEAGAITEEQVGTIRNDYAASADDNTIIQNIQASDTSLGWVGLAFAEEASDSVKTIAIDAEGTGDCVEDTAENVASGVYPISRPLFIYVKTNDLAERPDLVSYVDFYLSDDGIAAVPEVGYVEIPAETLTATRDAWEAAKP